MLLDPEGRSREVVRHGVPVVGRRQEAQRSAVAEAEGYGDGEHGDDRIPRRRAQCYGPSARRAVCGGREAQTQGRYEDECKACKNRPRVQATNDREREHDRHDLREADEVSGKHEVRGGRRGSRFVTT